MASSTWDIIDVHAHIRPTSWKPELPAELTEAERETRTTRWSRMTNPGLLAEESREGDVKLRLLSATIEGFFGTEGPTDIDAIRGINDFLAETVASHPGQLAALATVDAFAGEVAAREAERAITELGHVGIVIDSSRDQKFPGIEAVRPVLEVAARLKAPVLVHPVGAPNSDALRAGGGEPAYGFGRGLINGAAFFSILRSGVLDELPDLNLIFTAIGAGALVLAAGETEEYSAEARAAGRRPNVYFDIMGLEPAVVRLLVDILGAERVVFGTDWPIWPGGSRAILEKVFADAGLSPEQQALIASGNAKRILGAHLK
ncbi:amidohydrolase [Kaistia sp. 32K]|uniref:amidohydrolase family protein n=1 Tax=Kaistia sp. 32K TaxID=2795690 RepID=UPI001916C866|nr:amidohydrolase family protein [Kaistia sp. 32K]BCP55540.1 amidohydrolase [Kaistia sp. 32K]